MSAQFSWLPNTSPLPGSQEGIRPEVIDPTARRLRPDLFLAWKSASSRSSRSRILPTDGIPRKSVSKLRAPSQTWEFSHLTRPRYFQVAPSLRNVQCTRNGPSGTLTFDPRGGNIDFRRIAVIPSPFLRIYSSFAGRPAHLELLRGGRS